MIDDFDIENVEQCLQRMPEHCITPVGVRRCVSRMGSKGKFAFIVALMDVQDGRAVTVVVRAPARRQIRPGLWDFLQKALPSPDQVERDVYKEFYHAHCAVEGCVVGWAAPSTHRRAVTRLRRAVNAVRVIRGQKPYYEPRSAT